MAIHISETTVTFRRPFIMPSLAERQPAGTYRILVKELETRPDVPGMDDRAGVVFVARKRVMTRIQVPALSIFKTQRSAVDIDPGELARALEADGQPTLIPETLCGAVSP